MLGAAVRPSPGVDEALVPLVWRPMLKLIADAAVRGVRCDDPSVLPIPDDLMQLNNANIAEYPDPLGELADATWETSIYAAEGEHWQVLLDLSARNQPTTDLVLHVRVYDRGENYLFEPGMIYVP